MIRKTTDLLPELYEADETAWLDEMAEMTEQGRYNELDYAHLGEYLADMARSDRRKVESRLAILIAHVLKWVHQPDKRTSSWRGTIIVQRHKLIKLLKSGVLRNHAESVLGEAYADAVGMTMEETGLPEGRFSKECPYTLGQLVAPEVLDDAKND